ncbi:DUF2057 domain-containing protein [Pseudoalteromonas sp. JBTF-M23]|uniref:DUF2057 domain-containing protein n=1 Tax=Pseudoalteromonas caenipelagi TaxID=2726988 RepID=A0A849VHN1_9GAMM|nr:DUF2057 domain-containing protein [Pseudoalteromonas caenipelagi]NOU51187.1 DUF2057 domain-containing protein [Pseudoalteromonas caenipelagi]
MNIRPVFLLLTLWVGGHLGLAHSATVNFSQELYPLQVNEEEVEHSLFSKVTELTLAPGKYALKLKYSDLYELDYDEHEVVESEPFWVTMLIDQEGDYQLLFNRPADVELAKQFANKPSVTVQRPDNQVVVLQRIRQMPIHGGDVTPQQTPTSVTVQANHVPAPVLPANAVRKPKGVSHPDAYSMLEFWWQQASDAQRTAFLEKIKGQ